MAAQEVQLLLGFHTFRNHRHVHAARHRDDGADGGGVAAVAHEGLGDFQLVDGVVLELAETGIAGAEIVDGKADAKLAQAGQDIGDSLLTLSGALSLTRI